MIILFYFQCMTHIPLKYGAGAERSEVGVAVTRGVEPVPGGRALTTA